MKVHNLKIDPLYYKDVCCRVKKFEVRKNDRDFKVGDKLVLMEYKHGNLTGYHTNRIITYILDDSKFLTEGYVVLGMEVE